MSWDTRFKIYKEKKLNNDALKIDISISFSTTFRVKLHVYLDNKLYNYIPNYIYIGLEALTRMLFSGHRWSVYEE